jgi:hypothetical protein
MVRLILERSYRFRMRVGCSVPDSQNSAFQFSPSCNGNLEDDFRGDGVWRLLAAPGCARCFQA